LSEWQAPRRVSRPQGPPKPPAWALKNRFEGLLDEEMYDEWEQDRDFPRLPTRELDRAFTWLPVCEQDRDVNRLPTKCRRPPRNRKAQVQLHSQLHAHEVSPPEMNRSVSAQPYGSSYFLPGKLAGKAATLLSDTGCTINLLSRRLFDTLSARDRAGLEPYEGEHGTLADGPCITFYGVIELTGRVCDHIDFNKSAVMMAGRELACVDRFSRPLVGRSVCGTALYCTWALPGYSSLQSELLGNLRLRSGGRCTEGRLAR